MDPVIDPKVWASLQALEAAGEPGFLRELVDEFLKLAPVRIESLRVAGARGDAKALEHEAHAFKGSCGSLGAVAMADCCNQLETLGREGSCAGHAGLIDDLEARWHVVRAHLESAVPRADA